MHHSKKTNVMNTRHLSGIIPSYVIAFRLLVLATLLSTVIFAVADVAVKKSRLCIQYEIKSYKSFAHRCKTFNGMTKGGCFMECVRHQDKSCPCEAFQFRSHDGVCELLRISSMCMAENEIPDVTFVSLSACQFIPPWQSIKPTDQSGAWRWVADPPTKQGAIKSVSPLGGARYVARSFYKGLYLPGTYQFHFTARGPRNWWVRCDYNIQFLFFDDPSHYKWDIFYIGGHVPSTAIIGGYWPDGAPLYIVEVSVWSIKTKFPMYYNPETLRVYPGHREMHSEMGILVSTVTV